MIEQADIAGVNEVGKERKPPFLKVISADFQKNSKSNLIAKLKENK
ncbi:hypothetical protein [Acetobacterium wieringae]|nr:hypothetical protein [Acetobacterium wieringae]